MRDIAKQQRSARALHPIVLPGKRAFLIMCVSVLGLSILGGILALRSQPIIGSLCILIFCPFFIAWIIGLRRGATYLEIDSHGITRSLFFQKSTVRWEEIKNIRIGWVGHEPINVSWNREVMIDYRRDGKDDVFMIANKIFGLNSEKLTSLLMPFYEDRQNAQHTQAAE
jgi:hypothetical protein